MELARRYLARYGSGLGAFLALERALLRRFVNRGGSPVDFSDRMLPAIRRKYGAMLEEVTPRVAEDDAGRGC